MKTSDFSPGLVRGIYPPGLGKIVQIWPIFDRLERC